jgi:hypothetical protein
MESQSKTVQQRRMEILEWERDNRNLANRSQPDDLVSCHYKALLGKPFGCAVGRLLDEDLAEALDQMPESSVARPDIFNMLPQSVKDLGFLFLKDLQLLHDISSNWTTEGLSEEGMGIFENMVKVHCK